MVQRIVRPHAPARCNRSPMYAPPNAGRTTIARASALSSGHRLCVVGSCMPSTTTRSSTATGTPNATATTHHTGSDAAKIATSPYGTGHKRSPPARMPAPRAAANQGTVPLEEAITGLVRIVMGCCARSGPTRQSSKPTPLAASSASCSSDRSFCARWSRATSMPASYVAMASSVRPSRSYSLPK